MIDLYTAPTPNGWKASIMLEELGVPYRVNVVNLMTGDQHRPEYVKLNPNARIPTIVDRDNHAPGSESGAGLSTGLGTGFVVFESGAILIYLAEKYGKLLPTDVNGRSIVIQWLMFQMGGIGPMQGQANVFFRYWPKKIPEVIDRYHHETHRLYEVLERRLEGREWLCDDYSIADIANFTWVHTHRWSGVTVDDLPRVKDWLYRMRQRPAVQRGLDVPGKVDVEQFLKGAQKIVQK